MQFRILGPLELDGPHGQTTIAAPRQRIVLAMLLLEPGRVVSVDRLSAAVWDDQPPQTARGQIQICVSALRRTLADIGLPGLLKTRPPGYCLMADPDEVDLLVFQRLIREGRRLGEDRRYDEAVELFDRALRLWRGGPLDGVQSRLVADTGTRLEETRIRAVEDFIDLRLRQGAHQESIGELTNLVAAYPLREHLRAQLMLALFRSGRQAEALACYRASRQTLVDELGLEPGVELRRLEQAILLGETDYDLDPGVSVPSAEPMQVTYTPAHLLPPDTADFTGGHRIVEHLQRLVAEDWTDGRDAPRIISLFGKGGVGKSTLAIHVGHATAAAFPDGQLYARLNGNTRPLPPTRVLERFLRALGTPAAAIPEGLEERAETFRSLVAGGRILLVLDEAADEEQVRMLLPSSEAAVVLITSRRRLANLPGASHVRCDELGTDEAVELLARIAGPSRIYAEPRQALRLVKLCGQLPLALRTAAGRLLTRPHWTVRRMVDRLSDADQRLDELSHGGLSVRTNIAQSYESLNESARRLFRLLGMLDAPDFAEWICGPLLGTDDATAEDALDALVVAQLLDVDALPGAAARFRLNALVRAFARERLAEEDRPEWRGEALRRVLGAWLYAAEEAHRREYGGDHTLLHGTAVRWPLAPSVRDDLLADPLAWYAAERPALVAMIGQGADAGADDVCWDLALSTVTLFEAHSHFDDWRLTHDVALAAVRRAGNRLGEAAMLYSLGALAVAEYRLADATSSLLAAGSLFTELGVLHGRALVLRNLAFVDRVEGRPAQARARYEQALAWLRELGDVVGQAHVMSGLAELALAAGDRHGAIDQLTEALALAKGHSRRMEAQLTYRLGEAGLTVKDIVGALTSFGGVLEIATECGDRIGESYALYGLGLTQTAAGDSRRAVTTLRQAGKIAADGRDRMVHARIDLARAEAEYALGAREVAAHLAGDVLRLFQQLGARVWQARTLRLLGDVNQGTEAAAAAWREGLDLVTGIDSQDARQLADDLLRRLGGAPAGLMGEA